MTQQSDERARGWRSYRFSRMSEALDHSPVSSELWTRYTSLKRGAGSSCSAARGGGRLKTSRRAMRKQGRSKTGIATSAPGPTGKRQEHLDAIIAFAGPRTEKKTHPQSQVSYRRYSGECRFLSHTQLMLLKKGKDPTTKIFDDDEWIRALTEAQEIAADIPEDRLANDQSKADTHKGPPYPDGRVSANISFQTTPSPQCRRNCGLHSGNATARCWLQGGTEVLAIFHQLIFDEWASGTLDTPLARITVDERNCFGLIERGVRNSASSLVPKHAAVAGWKHRPLSLVEQEGVQSMPKDHGAEQGHVDGSSECSLAQGKIAAEARMCVAVHQAARTPAWIGASDSVHERRLQDEQRDRMQRIENFQLGGREKLIGSLPIYKRLMQPTFKFEQNETHRTQKSLTMWQTWTQLLPSRKFSDVRPSASVTTAVHGNWPPFPRLFMETSHWKSQWDVIHAMRERVQYSFVRTRRQNLPSCTRALASVGSTTSSRVHGHTILQKRRSRQSLR